MPQKGFFELYPALRPALPAGRTCPLTRAADRARSYVAEFLPASSERVPRPPPELVGRPAGSLSPAVAALTGPGCRVLATPG